MLVFPLCKYCNWDRCLSSLSVCLFFSMCFVSRQVSWPNEVTSDRTEKLMLYAICFQVGEETIKSGQRKKKEMTKASTPARRGSWAGGRDENNQDDKKGVLGGCQDAQSPLGLKMQFTEVPAGPSAEHRPFTSGVEAASAALNLPSINTVQQLRTWMTCPSPRRGRGAGPGRLHATQATLPKHWTA